MAGEAKTYVTTERAGYVVAGRRVPVEWVETRNKDGNVEAKPRPKLGFELRLLAVEAEYELQQGTITLEPSDVAPEAAKPKGKAGAGEASADSTKPV